MARPRRSAQRRDTEHDRSPDPSFVRHDTRGEPWTLAVHEVHGVLTLHALAAMVLASLSPGPSQVLAQQPVRASAMWGSWALAPPAPHAGV
jgi:hypothetical protein